MKTNTKTFLNLIERVEGEKRNYNINNLVADFVSKGFSVDDTIKIEYTQKPLKPADLKNIYEKENCSNIYFITAIKNKKTYNNNEYNFYCFMYDCNDEKIKEKNIMRFNFCYCNYESNAYYRNNAVFTILIYQNKKYIEAMNQKKQLRNENNKNYNGRYLFIKDFYNNYGEEENRQRYKYYKKDFDPKKSNNILINNLVLKNKYSFNFKNSGFYYKDNNIEIDKSGYILTYKIEELQRKAKALKNKRINNKIFTNKSIYINNIDEKIKSLESDLLLKFKEVSAKNDIKLLINLVDFTKGSYTTAIDDLKKYRDRLLKFDESNIFYNPVNFEQAIKEITEKEINIDTMIKDYNIYLNFKRVYKKIEEEQPREFFVNNGIKYPCLANAWDQRPFKIENNVIEVFGYSEPLENYLQL